MRSTTRWDWRTTRDFRQQQNAERRSPSDGQGKAFAPFSFILVTFYRKMPWRLGGHQGEAFRSSVRA